MYHLYRTDADSWIKGVSLSLPLPYEAYNGCEQCRAVLLCICIAERDVAVPGAILGAITTGKWTVEITDQSKCLVSSMRTKNPIECTGVAWQ